MQVPALVYGHYREVERRTRRVVTKMRRGATFEEAIGAHDLIDSAEHDGLFNLNYADSFLGSRPHYHVIYALADIWGAMVNGRLPWELEETVFNACLGSAWGILLLLPHSSTGWVNKEHRWVPLLQAAARFWPVLEAEGERYTYAGSGPTPLSHTATTVDYVLGNAGIFTFTAGPNPQWPVGPLRPPNWPALVEAYAERRRRKLH